MSNWNEIETLPKTDELVLAWCQPDEAFPAGRMMIWRADYLASNLAGPRPEHIQFPASHWMPLPMPPNAQ